MSERVMTWSVGATDNPMGQQHYEHEIQRAIHDLPDPRGWRFELKRLAPLRAQIEGASRFPARLLRSSGDLTARAVGRTTYAKAGFVHRFDLRLPPAGAREVVTAHDLPPLRFPDEGGLPSWVGASARRAYGLIVPSTFASEELRSLLGVTRTWVVPLGLSSPYVAPRAASEAELAAFDLSGRFVLHAAGASDRKNLAGLAAAWPKVRARADVTLVLAGPPDPRRDRLFAGLPDVRIIGKQPPETVARLMSAAAAVVVPSLYEGFGLPVLEGMACGVPVVAAATGALPEVSGDAALLVQPHAYGLAEGLSIVLEDEAIAARLRAAGPRRAAQFSWQRAAERHLDVYDELAAAP